MTSEKKRFTREEVAQVFGIPAELIGNEESTYELNERELKRLVAEVVEALVKKAEADVAERRLEEGMRHIWNDEG